jgi:hypothetical protein
MAEQKVTGTYTRNTGRFIVIDNKTKELKQVGGDGFLW